MKNYIQLLLLVGLIQISFAQNNNEYRIISSNVGSSGSSQTLQTANGTYKVSQSIGQSSVIGTYYNNGYYLRQGYQQPISKLKALKNLTLELRAKVYPNPFSQMLFISFSDFVQRDISIRIFDIKSRVIYTKVFLPAQRIELQIEDISTGTYFLNVSSGEKYFNTKLIKI
ncbi:hypothetical protein BWZ20_04470 [Winogradskyella sp. J14-2]|uniref:T9SS type A sorting domain-containing protein n=1 Tax=Winogradskyella sp. J14-2 TaxID=1936080 RepID=UPI000972A092|nr:T9SS type A sorting domain-containing protein [Winogradskyella sp. J14-2]APY07597.1 hypothetical protein BWZ20_04470 [Winogradskyella sp. J14-2]